MGGQQRVVVSGSTSVCTECSQAGTRRAAGVMGTTAPALSVAVKPTPQTKTNVAFAVDFICTFQEKKSFLRFFLVRLWETFAWRRAPLRNLGASLLTQRRLRTQSSEAPARESVYRTLEFRACASTRCRGGGSNKCAAPTKVPPTANTTLAAAVVAIHWRHTPAAGGHRCIAALNRTDRSLTASECRAH